MTSPQNYKQIKNIYNAIPKNIKEYFHAFEKLLDANIPYEIAIGYLLSQIEVARKRTLYAGIVKLHRVDSKLAWEAVQKAEVAGVGFRKLYKLIFNKSIPSAITQKIDATEKIRDDITQGINVSENEKRKAISDILKYAVAFNNEVKKIAGFEPFGNLRGFKGRGKPLPKDTSIWVLKGMGFTIT